MFHKEAESRCAAANIAVSRITVSGLEELAGIYAKVTSDSGRNVESLQSGLLSVWKYRFRQVSLCEKPGTWQISSVGRRMPSETSSIPYAIKDLVREAATSRISLVVRDSSRQHNRAS